MVERHLPKVNVAGSSPVFRSKAQPAFFAGCLLSLDTRGEYAAHRFESRLPLQSATRIFMRVVF